MNPNVFRERRKKSGNVHTVYLKVEFQGEASDALFRALEGQVRQTSVQHKWNISLPLSEEVCRHLHEIAGVEETDPNINVDIAYSEVELHPLDFGMLKTERQRERIEKWKRTERYFDGKTMPFGKQKGIPISKLGNGYLKALYSSRVIRLYGALLFAIDREIVYRIQSGQIDLTAGERISPHGREETPGYRWEEEEEEEDREVALRATSYMYPVPEQNTKRPGVLERWERRKRGNNDNGEES